MNIDIEEIYITLLNPRIKEIFWKKDIKKAKNSPFFGYFRILDKYINEK